MQWVALPLAFHFVHNQGWKNLLPLLILHKFRKGDPSLVQAHEDCSLFQLRYDLPIPLTHTTWNSAPPSYEVYAWLPRFVITRGCLLLAISSSCSWQRRMSYCRLARSSSARVARRCFFVSSGTSIRANILAQGVCALSYTLVIWLPLLSLWRSF